jgi:Protein of unknown function (DUF2510)
VVTNGAPANWYTDPGNASFERYWNGQGWTESVRPLQPIEPIVPTAPPAPTMAPVPGYMPGPAAVEFTPETIESVKRAKSSLRKILFVTLLAVAAVVGLIVFVVRDREGNVGVKSGAGRTPTTTLAAKTTKGKIAPKKVDEPLQPGPVTPCVVADAPALSYRLNNESAQRDVTITVTSDPTSLSSVTDSLATALWRTKLSASLDIVDGGIATRNIVTFTTVPWQPTTFRSDLNAWASGRGDIESVVVADRPAVIAGMCFPAAEFDAAVAELTKPERAGLNYVVEKFTTGSRLLLLRSADGTDPSETAPGLVSQLKATSYWLNPAWPDAPPAATTSEPAPAAP